MSAQPVADLQTQVHQLINVTTEACTRAGRGDLANAVAREASRRPRKRPVLVVAGAARRGKSTLVNALLGRREVSPTGVATVTGTFIIFSYADSPGASVVLEPDADDAPASDRPAGLGTEAVSRVDIDMDRLDDWVTVARNPANYKRVTQVEVRCPSELLRSVCLVDTPGVGGLDSAHGAAALQAVQQADALLFVVDASTPLSQPDLEFLAGAARRIDTVVIVVTKTDDYRGWERIVDDNRALLQRFAPSLATVPIVPISALLALEAVDAAPAVAARRLERSGIDHLRSVISDRVIARYANLALANSMQVIANSLTEVEPDIRDQIEAASGSPEVRERLRQEEERLVHLEADSAAWRTDLATGIDHIRVTYQDDLNGGLARLRRTYDARIERTKRADLDQLSDEFIQDAVKLTSTLAATTAELLSDLAVTLMGEVDAGSTLGSRLAQTARTIFDDNAHSIEQIARPDLSRVEKLSSLVSFSSGRAIGSLAATLPLVGPLGLPIMGLGLGVGVLFSTVMTKGRRELNQQTNTKRWLNDQVEEARRSVMASFSHQMIDVQRDLRDSLADYIKQQRQRAADLRNAADRSVREDAVARQADRAAIEQRAEQIVAARTAAHRLLVACGSDRSGLGAVNPIKAG